MFKFAVNVFSQFRFPRSLQECKFSKGTEKGTEKVKNIG